MAERWDLTIFEDDGETPVLGSASGGAVTEASFSTDPAHPRAYLNVPTTLAESSIDLLKGAAKIGEYSVVIADVAPIGNQDAGAVTGILADGTGQSAINGRRGLLRTYRGGGWIVAMDGVLSTPELGADRASYSLRLRDVRDRERKVKLFARTGTSTVFPRGVLNGYGRVPGAYSMLYEGDWRLVPPTTPISGVYRGGLVDVRAGWLKRLDNGRKGIVGPEFVLTPPMRRVNTPEVRRVDGAETYIQSWPNLRIQWRYPGGAWQYINSVGFEIESKTGLEVLVTRSIPDTRLNKSDGEIVEAVSGIQLYDAAAAPNLPTEGSTVEVIVVYGGPASEEYPFHFEGTAGEFLVAAHNGEFSEKPDGTLPDLGLRDDEDAFLALSEPIRIRATEVVDDARAWIEENIYQPLGAAPALDLEGRLSPIRYQLPNADVDLPEINNAIASTAASWSHPSENAVNVVRVTHYRDFAAPSIIDPLGARGAGDTISTQEVVVESRFEASVALLGEQVHEIETEALRSLGGPFGDPITGDVVDEAAIRLAEERTRQAIDRFLFGGQVFGLPCRRAALPVDLRVGSWVLVGVSYLPEYATQERGANRLCQIVAMNPLDPALVELTLEDAGPANQPIDQPTLGALSVDEFGIVSVPVSVIPDGGEARVDYAVSSTEPDPASGAWTFLGRTDTAVTLYTPPLPAGTVVWIRARGEQVGRRPSAWTNPVSITTPSTPRVLRVGVAVGEEGEALVSWETNAQTLGVRIFSEVHAPDVSPTLAASIDAEAADGSAILPATVLAGQAITVQVEPYTGWTGSAVSGTAGEPLEANETREATASDPALSIIDLDDVARTSEYVDVLPILGASVAEIWVFDTLWELPITATTRPENASEVTTVLDPGQTYRINVPPQGFERRVYFAPYSQSLEAGPMRRFTLGPAFVNDPWFEYVTDSAGSAANKVDVELRVRDPQGLGGTLRVWTNKASDANPNRTGSPDATLAIASTPATVTPAMLSALDEISVHPARGKLIYIEFENSNGATTGQQSRVVRGWSTAVTFDDLLRPAIVNALALADQAVEEAKIKQRAVGSLQLKVSGVARDNVALAAIDAARTDISQLSHIATNIGAIVNGRLDNLPASAFINLDATGAQIVIGHPKFALYANGDAAFAGALVAASGTFAGSLSAATGTFAGTVTASAVLAQGIVLTSLVDGELTQAQMNRLVVNGGIVAAKLSVSTLSELATDVGIVVSGELRNAAGTRYINLSATGSQAFIAHEKFAIYADGTAVFTGQLVAATGTFTGSLTGVTGTFTGTLTAGASSASPLSALNANLGTITAGQVRNAGNTVGIGIDAIEGSWAHYLNLNGSGYFLYSSVAGDRKFSVDFAGNVVMKGVLQIAVGGSQEIEFYNGATKMGSIDAFYDPGLSIPESISITKTNGVGSSIRLEDSWVRVFGHLDIGGPFGSADLMVRGNLSLTGNSVTFGAADSAGAGYRLLRVPN